MNITIVQTFTDGFTTYQSGQELSVPSEVAQRWIADGKAQADTDGQQSWLSSTEVAATRALVSADGKSADVVVYGATPAGIMAAISAAIGGVKVLLISDTGRIGGLVTGGLARTDYRGYNPRVGMNVLTQLFWRRCAAEYGLSLGEFGMDQTSPYAVEPKVALAVFQKMIAEYEIQVLYNYRVTSVSSQAGDIKYINLEHRTGGDARKVHGRVFIDATYSANLLIRSGVTYTYGREANATYSETYNGVRASAALTGSPDPYIVPGSSGSGLLPYIDAAALEAAGTADTRLQAFCHRLVMTNNPGNRLAIPEPTTYNPQWYELIGRAMANAPTSLDSLDEVFYRATIPQPGGYSKQDWNNQGAVSLDFIGGNAGYVTTDYAAQDAIVQNHTNYTLGLFKFLRTDSRVPAALKTALADWGFCADEFVGEGTGGLSPELYVRESARMVGDYVMTEAQVLKTSPVSQQTAIAFGNYNLDWHPASKRVVVGVTHAEGGAPGTVVPLGYYGIEYRCMLPKARECGNMLVCGNGMSASHSAFGTMRLEVTIMSMGEAAGVAAALAIKGRSRLHDLAGSDIQPYVRSYQINTARLLTIQAPSTNGTVTQSSAGAGWVDATFPPEFYVTKMQNEGNGNKGGRWTKFVPTFAADGRYRILLNAPGSHNAQIDCKIDVVHAGGTDTFYIDHKFGEWHFRELGVWSFDTSGTHSITITNDINGKASGIMSVDGVAWHPVP